MGMTVSTETPRQSLEKFFLIKINITKFETKPEDFGFNNLLLFSN
jgi:hypothetical protein